MLDHNRLRGELHSPAGYRVRGQAASHPLFLQEDVTMAIPKRSYWLRKVVSEEGMSYHISFRDGQGKIQELCVSYDFFMAFRRLELDERKLENWDYRHKEFSDIMEETLNWRALRLPKSIEERILEEERTEFLHRAINTLPEIQRRRFLLYYECDYKCYEIGAMEHRSAAAVAKSIASARKKVKEQMRKYLSA